MSMHDGMDLSRFKKISSDKKSSTLRHTKGHEVKIAHGGLTPKMRQHLEKMPIHLAEGEQVGSSDDSAPALAPAAEPIVPPAETASAPTPMPQNMVQASAPGPAPINAQDLKMEGNDNFGRDLAAGHIKPKTYADLFAKNSDGSDRGTLSKIGTLFGLMIGGAGAGMSHQPNALLGMMDKEISNDLEAQKAEAGNKQNWAKLNLEHQMNIAQIGKMQKEGNLSDAQTAAYTADAKTKSFALSKMQMNQAALHKLILTVNKLPVGSPQRLEAEKQLALLSQGVQNENYNIADRAAAASALAHVAFNPGNNDSASPASGSAPANGGITNASTNQNPEQGFQDRQGMLRLAGYTPIAEANEQKHMPGLKGQASVPLTSQDREEVLAGMQFQNQIKRFIDWTKSHSGDFNPKERKEGEALAAQLQGAYRLVTKGGVYKEGEQGFISNIIASTPTKFFNQIRVVPSLEAVQRESAKQLDERVKSKGFQGYEPPKSEGASSDIKEGTTGTYKGNPVVFKNGKWVTK